ncbi:hypothetical protein Tsubulata_030499 [Turnera subulata]|uniref:Phytocyanin domain-containing protein n=1 Tax=Turnera subulata TaxID=218843 RepID=A0A9Q0G8Q8_9ROSI|nr:hypothetical protein Tsubulata_030499 [Turnera subulata]
MASPNAFMIFLVLIIGVITPALAKEYIVGDDHGWTTGFDYQAWAKDKDFLVGDKLGSHNVFKVNGTEFEKCIKPPPDEALTSGNDTIVLATPGRKWYLCGVGQHCEVGGQKLAITVQALAQPPSIAPSPFHAKKPSRKTLIRFPAWW